MTKREMKAHLGAFGASAGKAGAAKGALALVGAWRVLSEKELESH